jgi:exo-beta-1,3-glucanase (GH17 family)
MRTNIKSTFSIILLGLCFWGCASQPAPADVPDATGAAMTATQSNASELELQRETPFQIRDFKPYLEDNWIGKAISYGCYREGQAPGVKGPSEAEILEDLNILKEHFNLIRVYGSDDDSERVLKVIHDNDLPIRMMLGVWVANETKHPERKAENLKQVKKAIELANRHPEIIAAINVGNESQVFWSWHRMEMSNLIRYIRMVRQSTDVPVTTADDFGFWNKPESKMVAQEIDFIVLHAYALWNGQKLDHAMFWTDMQIALGETGWATKYNPTKTGPGEQGSLIKGKVGVAEQQKFISELWKWVDQNQVTTFLFEAFDEPWKGGGDQSGPDEVEKHWGIYYEDRSPKQSFVNYLADREQP